MQDIEKEIVIKTISFLLTKKFLNAKIKKLVNPERGDRNVEKKSAT